MIMGKLKYSKKLVLFVFTSGISADFAVNDKDRFYPNYNIIFMNLKIIHQAIQINMVLVMCIGRFLLIRSQLKTPHNPSFVKNEMFCVVFSYIWNSQWIIQSFANEM